MNKCPPSLNPLRAFEAAGRLKNIRRAADELHVTPGAVSRQVQSLERQLGTRLFRREPKAIILTHSGEQYLAEITEHLNGIRNATLKLTGRPGRETLRIRAYTTFAMKWLIPRMSTFQQTNKTTDVRLTTSLEAVDFEHEDIDGAIRLGDGNWPGFEADLLVPNELIPVCSPTLLQATKLKCKNDMSNVTLLHSLARPDDWLLWSRAAGARMIDAYSGLKYECSALAYQAAMEGQGIAIAQKVLVADDLIAERLVQPFGPSLERQSYTYYLVYPRNRLRKPAFRKFRAWLVEQSHNGLSQSHPHCPS
jgi:LysR family transcriptional regulator, glycine cleavage system transcriptional activator